MGNRGHKLSKAHRRAQRYNIGMLDSLRVAAQWAVQDHKGLCLGDPCTCGGTAYTLPSPTPRGIQLPQDTGAGTYGPSTGADVWVVTPATPTQCTCWAGDTRARCTAWHADTTRTTCTHTWHDHAGTCTPQCAGTACTCTHVPTTGRPLHLPT